MPTIATKTDPGPGRKPSPPKPGAEATGTACTCPICAAPATYDLAPNPGPQSGGPHAPPPPPPPEVQTPPPEVVAPAGPWLLIVCSTELHTAPSWPENMLSTTCPSPAEPPPEEIGRRPSGQARKPTAPGTPHATAAGATRTATTRGRDRVARPPGPAAVAAQKLVFRRIVQQLQE